MEQARKYQAQIIPVDSEHSAIFQCLMGNRDKGQIKRLLLTCSGGPFYAMTRQQLQTVTKADALRHPNWRMGEKITIDCATLMNKGLEVIEAMHLYDMPVQQVDVLIHRQSIVHSMVEFTDGAVMAQLGSPDMRLPIQLALTYPARTEGPAAPLDLCSCEPLSFSKPDMETFRCLPVCIGAIRAGGLKPTAANGANEEAVRLFLEGKIAFLKIAELVEKATEAQCSVDGFTLEDVFEADKNARQLVINSVGD
jgi:1-deoxy-D-xylulose-5-phosphate reductoisomerase